MRGKSVMLLVIALVCGAIASVGLTQMLNKPEAKTEKIELSKVYVALDDLDINDELTADNVRLEEWPKDRVPEGALTKLEQLEGKFAVTRLYKGEPLLKRKISNKRNGAEDTIPEGYRAVAVRTSAQSAVSNLLLPGTRVDVICFLKSGKGISQTQTRTILKDIRVFSVNTRTTRESEGQSKATIDAKTVTLLVKPSQVQQLMLANQLGEIQFAMRKPDDLSDEDTGATTVNELLAEEEKGERIAPIGPPSDQLRPAETDLIAHLNSLNAQSAPAPQIANVSPSDEMVIITPGGPPRKFQWHGGSDYPQEVGFGGPSMGLAPAVAPSAAAPPPLPGQGQAGAEASKDSSQGSENAEEVESDE